MSYYAQEKIDEVNEAADLVELVSHYVALKRAGSVYKGLCPFHSEKTPSFVVTPHRRMFHCFGCGVGGGPIHFFMKITGQSFPEAVAELARRYGVELPAREGGPHPRDGSRENRAAIFEVLRVAREFFEANLWGPAGEGARRYLAGRGLNQRLTREFGLGLSLPGWETLRPHLAAAGFGDQIMLEAGLIKPGRQEGRYYDLFRDRLMVPILDGEGRVAAFGGRLLSGEENQPKYVNSPETPVYTKGRLLYGFHRARPYLRSAGLVFLVEGYFDLISMVAGGVNEVAAPLGTALTAHQAGLLRGQVERVMLLFDADEAGQRAAARTLPILLNAELDGRVLTLPKGHDPDTFMREFGAEALFEAAGLARDLVEFVAARLKSAHSDSVSGQARMVREVREILGQVPDPAKRWLLARRLAALLDLEEGWLGENPGRPRRQLSRSAPAAPGRGASYDRTAGELLKLILAHPETASPVLTEMAAWWPDDATRPLFTRLKARFEAHGSVAPEDAAGEESEEMAALVAEAAVSPRLYPPEEAGEVAEAYMERLRGAWRRARQAEISEAVKKAQARGDEAEVLSLLEEKKSLLVK